MAGPIFHKSGKEIFTKDHTVLLPPGYNLGKFDNGSKIIKGKSVGEVILAAITSTQEPIITAPSFSLSLNRNGTYEVGQSLSLVLTAHFDPGSIKGKMVDGAWQPNAEQAKRAGTVDHYLIDGVNTGTLDHDTQLITVIAGNNSYPAKVFYVQGAQPKDSAGNDYQSPLPAGNMADTDSFTGALKRFFGAQDKLTDPRSLASIFDNKSIGQSFLLPTGTTAKTFHIFLPLGHVIDSVVDVQSSNADITGQYVLQPSAQVADAGGNPHAYNHYIMAVAVPYGSPHDHEIRIKNG